MRSEQRVGFAARRRPARARRPSARRRYPALSASWSGGGKEEGSKAARGSMPILLKPSRSSVFHRMRWDAELKQMRHLVEKVEAQGLLGRRDRLGPVELL